MTTSLPFARMAESIRQHRQTIQCSGKRKLGAGAWIAESDPPVNIASDVRAFDGDFFRAWTIAGYVVIRGNIVIDTFNAVHFFNESSAELEERHSRNVLIEKNWFVRIRDKAVEPKDAALNWTVRHNMFLDCYVPFSFKMSRSGYSIFTAISAGM